MPLVVETAPLERGPDRKGPEPEAKESPVQGPPLHPLAGVLTALGAEDSSNGNSRPASAAILQRSANGAMRTLVMRRMQQGVGNYGAQQFVARLHRPSFIQRECSCGGTCTACQEKGTPEILEEDETSVVQRQASGADTERASIPADSPGQPLDSQTRGFMESRFGHDFSDVRVHTDSRAAQSADAFAANAYTTGRDIYFAAGKYAPGSKDGQHLLAHELTHVVQQDQAKSSFVNLSPQGSVEVIPLDDPLEREANEAAEKVASPIAPPTSSPESKQTVDNTYPSQGSPSMEKPGVDEKSVAAKQKTEESVGKPTGAAKADVEPRPAKPSAAQLPSSAQSLGTKRAPSRPSVGKIAPPAHIESRPAQVPPVQAPEVPAAEPPIDLADPTAISAEHASVLKTRTYDPQAAAAELEGMLDQLRAKAEMRKDEIRNNNDKVKVRVAESGAAQQTAVRSRVAESLANTQRQISDMRAELSAEGARVKAAAVVTTTLGQATLLLKTTAQAKAIEASAESHKKQATAAVEAERQAVRQFGADEGKRGRDLMEKQAREAIARGQVKAAGYPADERGQVQAEAVMKVASEVAAKLREPGPDLQSHVTDGGKELASGIADVDKELAKSIDDQTPKITADLFSQAAALGQQFETIRSDVFREVDNFVNETNQRLDEVETAATSELHALETLIVGQIEASVLQVQNMLDVETAAALTSIDGQVTATSQAAKRIRRPYVQGVRTALAKAETTVDQTAEQFTQGLDQVSDASLNGFTEAGDKVVGSIAAIDANVRAGLAGLRTPMQQGLETLSNKAKEGSDQINEQWGKSLAGVQKAIDEKYDEAVAGMVKEIEKNLATGKTKLTTQVNEAVAKNREPLDQLDTEMEEAAKDARDKYDHPVRTWLLSALTTLLKGLWELLKLVLVIVAAIIFIIIVAVFDVVAAIVLAVIAVIALAVYVLYGIIKNWLARVMSAETWWEAAWAGIVGILDITGIPNLLEGIIHHDIVNGRKLSEEEAGARFGAGILSALLFFLPMKLKARVPVEGPPVPVEVPIEPRPVVPFEPPRPPVVPPELPPAPEPKLAPPAPEPKLAPPAPEPKPAPPAPEPKPAPPAPEPKPAPPAPEPKPAPPAPEPKPAPPAPEPKPAPPAPEPKPAPPAPEPKPAPPAPEPKAPSAKVPEEAPKVPETKPTEPDSPTELEKAKMAEAEAVEAGKRTKVENLADLNKLKEKLPLKNTPPKGVEPGDPLWNNYVDYWNERTRLLEEELTKNPGKKPQTRPPLDWQAYSEFLRKFRRGVKFQAGVTKALQSENPSLRIEDNVGVSKPGETTKFADQLGVEKSKVEGWKRGEGTPEVETWSNKSRDFRGLSEADVNARVLEDINEARTKYGGEVEIRRPDHPLYGKIAKVTDVTLVYDAKLVPPDIRPSILKTAEGTGVSIEFR